MRVCVQDLGLNISSLKSIQIQSLSSWIGFLQCEQGLKGLNGIKMVFVFRSYDFYRNKIRVQRRCDIIKLKKGAAD